MCIRDSQGYNFVPPKQIDPSLGFGYDYDVTNAEVILTRMAVSYTHLRAHETVLDLVCRLLLEKKKTKKTQ